MVIWLLSQFSNALLTGSSALLEFVLFRALTVMMVIDGGILGGFLTGAYLICTDLVFQIHDNEAFSAHRHQHHKNFLRLHITGDRITIYPVGIRRVPLQWQEAQDTACASYYEPGADAQEPFHFELLEMLPIEITITPVARKRKTFNLNQYDSLIFSCLRNQTHV